MKINIKMLKVILFVLEAYMYCLQRNEKMNQNALK